MSKYITKQNGEKTDDYVVRGITTKKTLNILLLQAHQKTKERPKEAKIMRFVKQQ